MLIYSKPLRDKLAQSVLGYNQYGTSVNTFISFYGGPVPTADVIANPKRNPDKLLDFRLQVNTGITYNYYEPYRLGAARKCLCSIKSDGSLTLDHSYERDLHNWESSYATGTGRVTWAFVHINKDAYPRTPGFYYDVGGYGGKVTDSIGTSSGNIIQLDTLDFVEGQKFTVNNVSVRSTKNTADRGGHRVSTTLGTIPRPALYSGTSAHTESHAFNELGAFHKIFKSGESLSYSSLSNRGQYGPVHHLGYDNMVRFRNVDPNNRCIFKISVFSGSIPTVDDLDNVLNIQDRIDDCLITHDSVEIDGGLDFGNDGIRVFLKGLASPSLKSGDMSWFGLHHLTTGKISIVGTIGTDASVDLTVADTKVIPGIYTLDSLHISVSNSYNVG